MRRRLDEYMASAEFRALLQGQSPPTKPSWTIQIGDVDGDGHNDAAVELTFVPEEGNAVWYMGVLVWRNDGQRLVNAGRIPPPSLNGRQGNPSLKPMSDDGHIVIEEEYYQEDDARCCPSMEGSSEYSLVGGKLARVDGTPPTVKDEGE